MKKTLLLCKNTACSMLAPTSSRKKSLFYAVRILMLFIACAAVGVFAYMLMSELRKSDNGQLVPAVAYVSAFGVMLINSVFSAYGHIYKSRDNEILLCLPVSYTSIIVSRCFGVYLNSLVYSLVLLVPTGTVYMMMFGMSVSGVASLLIAMFTAPLLPSFAGIAVSYLFAKLRASFNNAYVTVAINVLFILIYIVCVIKVGTVSEYLASNGDILYKYFFPSYLFVNSLDGGVVSALVLAAIGITFSLAVLPIVSLKSKD
jgi:ABC-2 type transport system permease protein